MPSVKVNSGVIPGPSSASASAFDVLPEELLLNVRPMVTHNSGPSCSLYFLHTMEAALFADEAVSRQLADCSLHNLSSAG